MPYDWSIGAFSGDLMGVACSSLDPPLLEGAGGLLSVWDCFGILKCVWLPLLWMQLARTNAKSNIEQEESNEYGKKGKGGMLHSIYMFRMC